MVSLLTVLFGDPAQHFHGVAELGEIGAEGGLLVFKGRLAVPGGLDGLQSQAPGRFQLETATVAHIQAVFRGDAEPAQAGAVDGRVGLADTLLPGEAMGIKIGKQHAFPDELSLLGEAVGDEADSDAPFPEGRQQG